MRGEWIEITDIDINRGAYRLSPCGESGLKCLANSNKIDNEVSLPMRGEWIEMRCNTQKRKEEFVSPHAGRVD